MVADNDRYLAHNNAIKGQHCVGEMATVRHNERQYDKTDEIAIVKFRRTVARFVALKSVLSHCRNIVRTVMGEIATVRNVRYHPPQIHQQYFVPGRLYIKQHIFIRAEQ